MRVARDFADKAQLDVDMSDAFSPGRQRGFVVIPLMPRLGEDRLRLQRRAIQSVEIVCKMAQASGAVEEAGRGRGRPQDCKRRVLAGSMDCEIGNGQEGHCGPLARSAMPGKSKSKGSVDPASGVTARERLNREPGMATFEVRLAVRPGKATLWQGVQGNQDHQLRSQVEVLPKSCTENTNCRPTEEPSGSRLCDVRSRQTRGQGRTRKKQERCASLRPKELVRC